MFCEVQEGVWGDVHQSQYHTTYQAQKSAIMESTMLDELIGELIRAARNLGEAESTHRTAKYERECLEDAEKALRDYVTEHRELRQC